MLFVPCIPEQYLWARLYKLETDVDFIFNDRCESFAKKIEVACHYVASSCDTYIEPYDDFIHGVKATRGSSKDFESWLTEGSDNPLMTNIMGWANNLNARTQSAAYINTGDKDLKNKHGTPNFTFSAASEEDDAKLRENITKWMTNYFENTVIEWKKDRLEGNFYQFIADQYP